MIAPIIAIVVRQPTALASNAEVAVTIAPTPYVDDRHLYHGARLPFSVIVRAFFRQSHDSVQLLELRMAITFVNDDDTGNQLKVWDQNAGGGLIFDQFVAARLSVQVSPRFNDSGYANLKVQQDNNPPSNRSLLSDGAVLSMTA